METKQKITEEKLDVIYEDVKRLIEKRNFYADDEIGGIIDHKNGKLTEWLLQIEVLEK